MGMGPSIMEGVGRGKVWNSRTDASRIFKIRLGEMLSKWEKRQV